MSQPKTVFTTLCVSLVCCATIFWFLVQLPYGCKENYANADYQFSFCLPNSWILYQQNEGLSYDLLRVTVTETDYVSAIPNSNVLFSLQVWQTDLEGALSRLALLISDESLEFDQINGQPSFFRVGRDEFGNEIRVVGVERGNLVFILMLHSNRSDHLRGFNAILDSFAFDNIE